MKQRLRDYVTVPSSKLRDIDTNVTCIKQLLANICSMSSRKFLTTSEMSQIYLKKNNNFI